MAINLNVPSTPYTTYTTTLDGAKYVFNLRWNTRQKVWYLDVLTSNGTPIALNSALLPNTDLLRKTASYSPKGYLTLIKETNTSELPTRFNIGVGKDYQLVYFTEKEVQNGS